MGACQLASHPPSLVYPKSCHVAPKSGVEYAGWTRRGKARLVPIRGIWGRKVVGTRPVTTRLVGTLYIRTSPARRLGTRFPRATRTED